MTRFFQLLLLLCTFVCASCSLPSRLRLAYKRHELRMVLVDWGIKPHLLPVLFFGMGMSCFGAGCNLMEGVHQTNPNYRNPVPFSSNWWERREERLRR